jgi:hypothetical protein
LSERVITAGECVAFSSSLEWVDELVAEALPGDGPTGDTRDVTLSVQVEAGHEAFPTRGWELLARGAWRRGGELVLENVCTAGFDLHLSHRDERPSFTYRWRPPARDRAAARVLRSRFHLLARAALLQYPPLWLAGTKGRAPLHASACSAGGSTALVTAHSGIGRSTLVLGEVEAGARATGDNLAVGDGTRLWGVVEPVRVQGGGGRRMPHGRHETPLPNRLDSAAPSCVVVLTRGTDDEPSLSRRSSAAAADVLVASTYMAGELRRYWPFAAALTAGTGRGSSHPAIVKVAGAFSTNLPCYTLALGRETRPCLFDLLANVQVAA